MCYSVWPSRIAPWISQHTPHVLCIAAVKWWQILRNLCTTLMKIFWTFYLMTACLFQSDSQHCHYGRIFPRIYNRVFPLLGSWHSQDDRPHYWNLSGSPPPKQVHGVSPGQCPAPEDLPLQTGPVPQEGICPQEGRQHCKCLIKANIDYMRNCNVYHQSILIAHSATVQM